MSRYFPKTMAELVHWYERYISPISLVAGFISDNVFLTRRVDLLQTNLLLGFYLALSAVGVVVINLIETGRVHNMRLVKMTPIVIIVVQFCFGGLFSGFLSLYSRSASFAFSWVFVILLAVMLLGNERFTRFYVRVPVQLSVYFGVLLSFLIFFLPVVFHAIGPTLFLLSCAVSVLVITAFMWLLSHLVPEKLYPALRPTIASIGTILVLMNIFYFTNLLPPLPLALKEAGVYHSVTHEADGSYTLLGEPVPWYDIFQRFNTTYHTQAGEPVYVFSSVFAPTGLSIPIEHEWQRYDDATRQWVTKGRVSFPINGGRDGGYRGYSIMTDVQPGQWRVNVLTQYGQLIGRISFTVVNVSSTPQEVKLSG